MWRYIRNSKIVMYGPYCVHIWHLYVPCGFAENFPAITWRVLAKSKQIVCITHLIITWRNKWVCKIGKSADKLWFLICCIWRTCKNQFWKFNKNCGWYLLCFCHACMKIKGMGGTAGGGRREPRTYTALLPLVFELGPPK